MKYFLSLGSNLGNKKENLRRAILLLEKEGVKILRTSSLYRTQPVSSFPQPWFYNQVIEIEASSNPHLLLDLVKRVEVKMKRKSTVRNGPRIIDIDILLADQEVIQTKKLMIPHPKLEMRNFVMVPLIEIAPDLIHPLLNQNIWSLWKKGEDRSIVKRIEERDKKKKKKI